MSHAPNAPTVASIAGGPTLGLPAITGFEILEQVGSGGHATVYRARQRSLDRVVAVKVLSGSCASDPDRAQKFVHEARLASRLHHPNILQAIDVGYEDGLWYFVMEYVAGLDACELVRQGGPLSPADALDVVHQVAQAIQYAAQRGILHGDIKPENILVAHDGTAKVVDFGIARLTRGPLEELEGTRGFVAPEVLSGATNGDVRSDLFSLGVTLLELLSGEQVRTASQPILPADLGERLPRVDAGIHSILRRLLSPDPARRFQSADELLVALQELPHFQARVATGAVAVSTARQALPLARRSGRQIHLKWLVLAAMAGLLGALVALIAI